VCNVNFNQKIFKLNIIGFFSDDPLVGSIATEYLQNREQHDKTAQEWTSRYAT